jgi:hypothetical protein
MVPLGGVLFLMSEVPLYAAPSISAAELLTHSLTHSPTYSLTPSPTQGPPAGPWLRFGGYGPL